MNMLRTLKCPPFAAALVALFVASHISALAENPTQKSNSRIQSAVDDQVRTYFPGSVRPTIKSAIDLGRVSADTQFQRVTIVFKRSQQQQADLDTLLAQQQDPASPNYHRWLTPAQFQARFGISDADLAAVKAWLQSHGLSVDEESTDNTLIVFSGPAAAVEQAFKTEIHRYSVNGDSHIANSSDVSMPAALADIVLGVSALDDFRPHPRPHVRKLKADFTSNLSGNHYIAPDDFATIYNLKPLYAAGINGTGQKIAIVGQTDLIPVAISTFRSLSGLPASAPVVLPNPLTSAPGLVPGDIDEASLDIEWAGAVAPGATIVYVNFKNAFDSLTYAINHNVAPVISSSYGDCEPNLTADIASMDSLFQQANAQGQTIVGASGDSGAADCDYPTGTTPVTTATHGLAVDFPPSSPNVTAVGGSRFNEGSGSFWSQGDDSSNGSALNYIPEVAWNDTTLEISQGGSLSASGGGFSTQFPKPSWQTGLGVPADTHRDVPDVTFSASSDHDGYLICSGSKANTTGCVDGYRNTDTTLTVVGGTSAGAPSFAGVVALLNQKTGTSQGNINHLLYSLAATSLDAFHDITSGDNKVPCKSGTADCPAGGGSIGYSAGVGYDQVTGLGSINVSNLVYELAGATPPTPAADFQLGIFQSGAKDANLKFNRGTPGASDTVTVDALNGFTGTVALTCSVSSSLANTTCQITPASLSGSGTATLTVSASPLAGARDLPEHETPSAPLWGSGVLGLCALVFVGKAPRSAANKMVLSILLIAMVTIVGVGCGGGGGSAPSTATTNTVTPPPVAPPPATGSVTVQASSGSIAHSVQISVTVN